MGKRKRQIVEQDSEARPDHNDRFRNRLDTDVLAYFHEVRSHFDAVDDAEERQRIADNCLQEALTRPLQVATDAECSRILEAFVSCASEEGLIALADSLVDEQTWLTVCTKYAPQSLLLICLLPKLQQQGSQHCWVSDSRFCVLCSPFGSHVTQRLLEACCTLQGTSVKVQTDFEKVKLGCPTYPANKKQSQATDHSFLLCNAGFAEAHGPDVSAPAGAHARQVRLARPTQLPVPPGGAKRFAAPTHTRRWRWPGQTVALAS